MEKTQIQSFTDLKTWQEGHKLVIDLYKITGTFPKEELFGLVNQLRRASISITSNIAEGFSRASFRDKARFYYMALGSLTEIQNQLLVAKDIGYIDKDNFHKLADETIMISKMMNGLIKSCKTLIHNT